MVHQTSGYPNITKCTAVEHDNSLMLISRTLHENRVLLGYYAASSGNSLLMFRDKLSVPKRRCYHYSLRNNPAESSSHPLRGGSLKSSNNVTCFTPHRPTLDEDIHIKTTQVRGVVIKFPDWWLKAQKGLPTNNMQKLFRLLIFLIQPYMFRATNSPIFRSTFWLCIWGVFNKFPDW